MKDMVSKLNIVNKHIMNKEYDNAEKVLEEALESAEKTEINEYGQLFDFDNEYQFVFFCNIRKTNYKIGWKRTYISDIYYLKGIILFDKKLYNEAIINFKKSLQYNPVKVKSYMEIMECYIKLKNTEKFKITFKETLGMALSPIEISMIYRKYAFLLIELKDYELAYNILKYTALIFYRKENEDEIKYLSSLININLPLAPDIGTVEYIRKYDLEYKPSPKIKTTYISIAKSIESDLQIKNKDISRSEKIKYLERLVDIYRKLYFFECESYIHNLLINTTRDYLKLIQEEKNN